MLTPSIILETTTNVAGDIKILENANTQNGYKVVFKARLQTAEEKNQNGRYYKKDICEQIVNLMKPKAKSRSLLQEIDHPLVVVPGTPAEGGDMAAKKRAVTIEIKNCGSLIRDIYMEKNDVIGIIETLTAFRGPDLYNLIVNDRVNIGFSLRMFGRLVMDQANGYMLVQPPLKPITYDVVSNPSHQSATVMEFLPEDASDLISLDMVGLTESVTYSSDGIRIVGPGITEYIREMLEYSYRKNRFITFKI